MDDVFIVDWEASNMPSHTMALFIVIPSDTLGTGDAKYMYINLIENMVWDVLEIFFSASLC